MLVSVIIPAYNSARTIKKCALSVLNQSYRNIEVIVVNDGSKDKTLHKLTDLMKSDQRLRVINQDNTGKI